MKYFTFFISFLFVGNAFARPCSEITQNFFEMNSAKTGKSVISGQISQDLVTSFTRSKDDSGNTTFNYKLKDGSSYSIDSTSDSFVLNQVIPKGLVVKADPFQYNLDLKLDKNETSCKFRTLTYTLSGSYKKGNLDHKAQLVVDQNTCENLKSYFSGNKDRKLLPKVITNYGTKNSGGFLPEIDYQAIHRICTFASEPTKTTNGASPDTEAKTTH